MKRPPPKNYENDPSLTSYLPPPINYDPRPPSPKPVLLTPSDSTYINAPPPVSKPSYSEPTGHYGPPTRTYSPPDINYQVQKYAPPQIHYEEVYNHVAPSGLYTPPIERYASGEEEESSNLVSFDCNGCIPAYFIDLFLSPKRTCFAKPWKSNPWMTASKSIF